MNTFLPYSDFKRSALCLDRQRLGKQRLETQWLIKSIEQEIPLSRTHPLILMWKDWLDALVSYGCIMCDEWASRGYNDNIGYEIALHSKLEYKQLIDINELKKLNLIPDWLGNQELHASHRSNLLRKDPVWYSHFKWTEPNNLPYYWPVNRYNYDALRPK